MECLEKIVGLSQTTCDCFDEGKPEDFNESTSGEFIDELDGFNLKIASGADDCARGGLWDRLEKARDGAIVDTKKDLLSCIGKEYKSKYDLFSGQLGDTAFKDYQNLTQSFAGIKIFPNQLKGGVFILKRLGILVNNSVVVTVDVYKRNGNPEIGDSTLVASYTTPGAVTGGVLTWNALSTPLELPMWSYNGRIDYYIVLRLDGTFQPVDNRRDCGCGGVERPYLTWIDFRGVRGNDATNLNSFNETTSINGLVLDAEMKCKTAEIICNSERPLDFENDTFAQQIANAVRFRAAVRMYNDILSSDQINRYTMLSREELMSWVKFWDSSYGQCIEYLCSIASIDANGCLECRDQTKFTKTGLLA